MFHDKEREDTDKGEKNIPKNSAGDRMAIGIRARNVPI